ncbi:beta-N-acetylhexosaminidase [Paenibacillus sp. NPDC056579]|uniref:beta-N-acetylhexosaminidase n=1 Tax=Paenibacillus sp. NPDC056579 TaxID=3345871 RepID=UPI00367DD6D8
MSAKPYRIVIHTVMIASLIALSGCGLFPSRSNTAAPAPTPAPAQTPAAQTPAPKDPIRELVESMSIDEKIGQMLLIGIDGTTFNDTLRRNITERHIGGFIFYSNNIESSHQAWSLISAMRKANTGAKLPLLLSADQEGGRVSRMPKELPAFPASRDVGKTNDKALAFQVGSTLGETMKAYGLNVDFAPVLDVNSNPSNPVIGDRSFGSTAATVSSMGIEEMKGIQSQGVIPVVKHFPGHGDTSVDSHTELPVVNHDLDRLRKVEFVPFAEAIRQGADAVMVAHLLVTKLDPDVPASMSRPIIQNYLRGELGFQGVVITDDMTMGAITKSMPIERAAVKSVQAGADIILVGHEDAKQQAVLQALKQAVQDGTISGKALDDSVYRIAKLKRKTELSSNPVPEPDTSKLSADIKSAVKPITKS